MDNAKEDVFEIKQEDIDIKSNLKSENNPGSTTGITRFLVNGFPVTLEEFAAKLAKHGIPFRG